MNKTHGMRNTVVYWVWRGMLERCNNPKHKSYARYGGRGIKVCDAWHSVENFYADMGKPSAGMQIDRKDNDGNYCKENCHWVSRSENMKNQDWKGNLTGVKGVSYSKADGRFQARTDRSSGVWKCLYQGKSLEDAIAARKKWELV